MDDAEYLPLSWLSQADYCLRRAALLMNKRVWAENAETAKGRAEHERVHTKRRTAKLCERYGVRVQNSVFEVLVDSAQLAALKHEMAKIINEKEDSVRFYRLGNTYQNRIDTMGRTSLIEAGEALIL